MSKLLNYSLRKIIICAGIVLVLSIPIYYFAISRLWQYEMDEHNVMLTTEAAREDSFLIIGAVTLLSVVFFTFLLGALILMNRILSKKMWQPFYQSLAEMKAFNLNQPHDISFKKTGITEFDDLNTSLEKLLTANINIYNQQKEFADNASHELQTPLAVVQSKLDLLSQSEHLNDAQFQLIEEALFALSRVSRINKNLLLLTKIENSQFADKVQVDISAVLQELLSQLSFYFEEKELTLQVDIEPGVMVEGNRILLEILLGNLLTNAIRHSSTPGTVQITLRAAHISIKNSGKTALLEEQLFKRFAITSSHSSGSGLGLALIKQICIRYGWQVGYQFEGSMHVFSITF
ncbi:Signal transduction histidine kinase [Chitinophaga jiangningensis]|uniref:histidine kinase n=1 Tax=Chitinophaga jiangningensis TaxID=1419482 RepID=A0A1M7IPP8_9BACT|nr:HAMP domain-containing sensor histidine kinase [Chitinophaga jiangningensis]SHM42661.1 Signal transduction histidine kinase [Chitinophaga jiangningensis]